MKLIALTRYVDRLVEAVIVMIFIALVVVGAAQIFNRFVLNSSLSWSEEFQRYAHIWLVYLAVPVAYNRGTHIGVDIIRSLLPRWLESVIGFLVNVLWLALSVAILVLAMQIMRITGSQTAPGLGISYDYIYMGLVVGAAYLLFVVVRKIACTAFRLEMPE